MADYSQIINDASYEYKVDANLIRAIIQIESSGNPKAVSSAGAQGLMQIMPGTFKSLNPEGDPFDPYDNINAGTKYIKQLLDNNDGDVKKALASYNAGAGNVAKYGYEKYSYYYNKVLLEYENLTGVEYTDGSDDYHRGEKVDLATGEVLEEDTAWYIGVLKVLLIVLLIIGGIIFLAMSVSGVTSIKDAKKKVINKAVDKVVDK